MRQRLASALFTLWTVLAMLGAHAAPAYAFAHVDSAAASRNGDREAVSAGTSRVTPDARKLDPRPQPLGTVWSTASSAQPSVRATSLEEILPLVSWIGWETASRARARLMVFLN